MTNVLMGLAPVVSSQTRLLILGSFPGVASLAAQQYYGHPQNQFWKILRALYPSDFPSDLPSDYPPDYPSGKAIGAERYKIRTDWLLSKKLGVWDVYAACERQGSLDTNIRNAAVNDFSGLMQLCPQLQAIAHNGGESFKHSRHTQILGLPVYKLPSTSPANASWSFERKLAAWREVFEKHELL